MGLITEDCYYGDWISFTVTSLSILLFKGSQYFFEGLFGDGIPIQVDYRSFLLSLLTFFIYSCLPMAI